MGSIIRKELIKYFRNPTTVIFLIILPILFILFFSYAMENYINNDYKTFEDGRVLFIYDDGGDAYRTEFQEISENVTAATGVVFEEVSDYEAAKKEVEQSLAYAVIRISSDGFSYYRSDFNEPTGGKIVRSTFEQLTASYGTDSGNTVIAENNLHIRKTASKIYYTLVATPFLILFFSFFVSVSVIEEKELGTLTRLRISQKGFAGAYAAKLLAGFFGCVSVIIFVYVFSSLVMGVKWEGKLGMIFFIFLLLSLFSSSMGLMIGSLSKNKTIAQDGSMVIAMLCGYLGGSITPSYLMENIPVMNYIIKISPLYWANKALINLYQDTWDKSVTYSIIVIGALTLVMLLVTILKNRRMADV